MVDPWNLPEEDATPKQIAASAAVQRPTPIEVERQRTRYWCWASIAGAAADLDQRTAAYRVLGLGDTPPADWCRRCPFDPPTWHNCAPCYTVQNLEVALRLPGDLHMEPTAGVQAVYTRAEQGPIVVRLGDAVVGHAVVVLYAGEHLVEVLDPIAPGKDDGSVVRMVLPRGKRLDACGTTPPTHIATAGRIQ